jgi:hypothetical protein
MRLHLSLRLGGSMGGSSSSSFSSAATSLSAPAISAEQVYKLYDEFQHEKKRFKASARYQFGKAASARSPEPVVISLHLNAQGLPVRRSWQYKILNSIYVRLWRVWRRIKP